MFAIQIPTALRLNLFNVENYNKFDFNKLKQYRFLQLENPELLETQQYIRI